VERTSRNRDFPDEDFVRTRKRHWMQEAQQHDKAVAVPDINQIRLTADDSNFIISAPGATGIEAVFEDSTEVGWFYVYDVVGRRILNGTHVYNRTDVQVDSEDVDVLWSNDPETGAVAIWAEMRAFLGRHDRLQIRAQVKNRNTPGIAADEWPPGFGYAIAK
jgi:hypothetical protein